VSAANEFCTLKHHKNFAAPFSIELRLEAIADFGIFR
jgi:hypothetical protein